jgi:hypothetical protein
MLLNNYLKFAYIYIFYIYLYQVFWVFLPISVGIFVFLLQFIRLYIFTLVVSQL